jgi:hypothetical protein
MAQTAYQIKFILELTAQSDMPGNWVTGAILEVLEAGEVMKGLIFEPIGIHEYQATALLLLNDKDPGKWIADTIDHVLEYPESIVGVQVLEVPEQEIATTQRNIVESIMKLNCDEDGIMRTRNWSSFYCDISKFKDEL